MGVYLNPGNEKFAEALNSQIYVDKTGLLGYTNSVLHTNQKYVCVSRPRRFGKSMAINMLAAYYSRGCKSEDLFRNLKVSELPNFTEYLNRFDTICLNMQDFLSQSKTIDEMLELVRKSVLWELLREYPEVVCFDKKNLTRTMQDIYGEIHRPFLVLIDEWDCVFREYKDDQTAQEKYLDFLRDLLKDKAHIHLAYMTGILPIKKYGTHSALNMFDEFSMLNPEPLTEYVGFTEKEVERLCNTYDRDMKKMKEWYDGYYFQQEKSIYNPCSVVAATLTGVCDFYWNKTTTFEPLRLYVGMNLAGLKDDVLSMMAGESISINTGSFINDMVTFRIKDDVLTLLIHLGYLNYNFTDKTVAIPNQEVYGEFVNATSRFLNE